MHSAQGVTADTSHAVLSETASRAMIYVGMSRGCDNNRAYIYTRETGEGDPEHRHLLDTAVVHHMRRGNKYSAAHYMQMILANDDLPLTMHAHAERTDRQHLRRIVTDLLASNDRRRSAARSLAPTHRRRTRPHSRLSKHHQSRPQPRSQ